MTRREGRSSVSVNDEQRSQIVERLRSERTSTNENLNIRVNIGERLPPRVRARPLPPDIVRIAPQYRDYEYTVVDNRIYIVDPRTREVVDLIGESGPAGVTTSRVDRQRAVITREQRDLLKQAARRTMTVGSSAPSGSTADSSCLTLQPVPKDGCEAILNSARTAILRSAIRSCWSIRASRRSSRWSTDRTDVGRVPMSPRPRPQ
jgi:hypothetical protein